MEGLWAGVIVNFADIRGNKYLESQVEKSEEEIEGSTFPLIHIHLHDFNNFENKKIQTILKLTVLL